MKCPSCRALMTEMDHGRCPRCQKFCGCSFSPTSKGDWCSSHSPWRTRKKRAKPVKQVNPILPVLPTFARVHQVIRQIPSGRSVCLIVPAAEAGRRHMYHAIRIDCLTGSASCIGRELPIGLARAVSLRQPRDDGKPIRPRKSA
jgi:hypothetical protein